MPYHKFKNKKKDIQKSKIYGNMHENNKDKKKQIITTQCQILGDIWYYYNL